MDFDRYARQRMIEWWDQERLRKAHILIAGAGALGNEVIKNLAMLGIGHLLIIDFDKVEHSNLSRTVLFQEQDIERPKVEVVVEAVARLNPNITIQTINGDLFYDVGLGSYRRSDLAIGCLDNLAARSQVGQSCSLAGIPYLDGGMWSLGGEVRWFMAATGPCFDCTLSSDDIYRMHERRSCTGFRSPTDWDQTIQMSTIATTAAIIGGLLAQEAVKWLCNYPVKAGKAIVYNGQSLTLHRAELMRNPDCLASHIPYQDIVEFSASSADLTPRQLLSHAHAELEAKGQLYQVQDIANINALTTALFLELGRDFLLYFHCTNCGQQQEMNQHLSRVLEGERVCPSCGFIRRAEVIRTVDENSPYLDRTLFSLGVPAGEVLQVHTGEIQLLYAID